MRVLITGVTGFAGSHLAEYAMTRPGVEVYGTIRTRSRLGNISHLLEDLKLVECDLRDPFSVERAVDEVRPDFLFHLAAQSFVPASWTAPEETITTNVLGQLHLLEAVRKHCPDARVQIACSSEEYGLVHPDEIPINEDNPLRPLSPYGVSKVAQDLLGYQYHRSYGLWIVRTRAFNHTGPRRGEVFAVSSFAKQVAEIEAGMRPPVLLCGNLDARRDFTDVRDMVQAYWLALEHGEPGEVYVIASGRSHTMRQVLDLILELARVPVEVRVDPERLRPSDVPVLEGDSSKFRAKTGWTPTIPLRKTLSDLLDYWRDRTAGPDRAAPGRSTVEPFDYGRGPRA
ncbi:MAG TPA: GDP-mannose 4,6-dehydratase [Clostridiales bacterium]|nr:GDP-mannose 4,6-dehydratase [Clostridiales bacterium]